MKALNGKKKKPQTTVRHFITLRRIFTKRFFEEFKVLNAKDHTIKGENLSE